MPVTFTERGRTAHLAWARATPVRSDPATVEILLLHGFTDSAACWTPFLPTLGSRGVLAIDARGHGESGLPEGPFDTASHAEDAELVLTDGQSIREGGVVVIGHSMGAATAASLAARRPDLVRALVLEDPPSGLTTPTSQSGIEPAWLAAARALDLDARIAANRAAEPAWDDAEHEPWAVAKEQLDPCLFGRVSRPPVPLAEVLADVTCPVLLLHGDADRDARVTPELARTYARVVHGRLRAVHVEGAGHCVRRDRPGRYAAEVTAFLDSLPAR